MTPHFGPTPSDYLIHMPIGDCPVDWSSLHEDHHLEFDKKLIERNKVTGAGGTKIKRGREEGPDKDAPQQSHAPVTDEIVRFSV